MPLWLRQQEELLLTLAVLGFTRLLHRAILWWHKVGKLNTLSLQVAGRVVAVSMVFMREAAALEGCLLMSAFLK